MKKTSEIYLQIYIAIIWYYFLSNSEASPEHEPQKSLPMRPGKDWKDNSLKLGESSELQKTKKGEKHRIVYAEILATIQDQSPKQSEMAVKI